MTSFALIHGPMLGPACWDRVRAVMHEHGLSTQVIDLPVDRPEYTAHDFAAEAVRQMTVLPDDVIVVGHSLSALLLPAIAAARPVGVLVYLAAVLEPEQWTGDRDWVACADELLFHDLLATELEWARSTVRPMRVDRMFDTKLSSVPDGVHAVGIATTVDRVLDPDEQIRRWKVGKWRPLLRVGTGHCPHIVSPLETASSISAAPRVVLWEPPTGTCGWKPVPESEFVEATYDEYMHLATREEQLMLFNRITYASRAAIVRTHIERWLAANRANLTPEQIAFLEDSIEFASPENYDPATREAGVETRKELVARGYRLFSRDQMAMALMPQTARPPGA